MYDYAAADDDEVSFEEGDIILDVEEIDEGWMQVRKKGGRDNSKYNKMRERGERGREGARLIAVERKAAQDKEK